MKKITKYKSNDGKVFDSKKECLEYELLCDQVDQVISQLDHPKSFSCNDFENGEGYIQHDPIIFLKVKKELLQLMAQKIDHHWISKAIESIGTDRVHPSLIGRLLSDYGISPFNRYWYRIQATDSQFREWGQIYFANNPDKGKNFCINRKEATQ